MEKPLVLDDDLKSFLEIFDKVKAAHIQEQATVNELLTGTEHLKTEVAMAYSFERKTRAEMSNIQHKVAQLQETITSLLDVKAENVQLKKQIKETEQVNTTLKEEINNLKDAYIQEVKHLKDTHASEIAKFKETLTQQVTDAKKQLSVEEESFRQKVADLQQKLTVIEMENADDLALTTAGYEERMQKLQTDLNNSETEKRRMHDSFSDTMMIYQKKLCDLERQLQATTRQLPPPPQAQPQRGILRHTTSYGSDDDGKSSNSSWPTLKFDTHLPPPSTEAEVKTRHVTFPGIRKRRLFTDTNSTGIN